jgi:hypothetical protein
LQAGPLEVKSIQVHVAALNALLEDAVVEARS